MKHLLVAAILAPTLAHSGTPTEPTVNFCNINADQDAPKPKAGWSTFAYCRNEQLVMVVESKRLDGTTRYTEKYLGNENYSKAETGLPCNISIYKCNVESY